MSNLIVRNEAKQDLPLKQSLQIPAAPPTPTPFPRSLVMPGGRVPPFPTVRARVAPDFAAREAAQVLTTREQPAKEWRADFFTVTPLAFTWLDNDVAGYYMPTRRSITVINHDPANGIWLRHSSQSVILGAFIQPGGNISLPLGPECKIYAQGIGAGGSNLTFIQLGGI
jgi:hypothetical protein